MTKTALVTGSTSGIGQAVATSLAAAGMNVVLNGFGDPVEIEALRAAIADELGRAGATVIGTATTPAGAEKISSRFATDGIKGQGMVLNVTDANSVSDLLAGINQDYSAPAILVNNAGITNDDLLMRMSDEDWSAVIDTNLSAIFRLSKACLRGMMKAHWGRIINIGSVVGSMGNAGQTNYAAAKAGIAGFARSLAREVGSRNITVNTVSPGFIDTEMTSVLSEEQQEKILNSVPMGRLGKPAEIAAVVTLLASEQGGYISGENIHVNGGMYMV